LRYFIEFAYKGTRYHGWQSQPNAISVQETLNTVFSTLLPHPVSIMGAGRTDTGVHAKQMFGHFDTEIEIESSKFIHKANSFLPTDIVLYKIFEVKNDAHARFDAVSRTYEYHITNHKNVFTTELSWLYAQNLDIEAMNKAAKLLMNYTDFQCFSKSNTDVNNYNCNLTEAYWKYENQELIFTISANRFLRNMVRAIVGTLINIGLNKTSETDFIKIIEDKNRENAGFSVPAHGLFLTKIEYPYIKK
jgi:tRNA pseudouridine38-40 synthase